MKTVFIALNRCASGDVSERGVAKLFNVEAKDVTVEEFAFSVNYASPFQRLAWVYSEARNLFEPAQFVTVRGVDQISGNFLRKHQHDISLAVTGNSTMLNNKRYTLNYLRSMLRYLDIIDSTSDIAAKEEELNKIYACLAELTPSYKILLCPQNPFATSK